MSSVLLWGGVGLLGGLGAVARYVVDALVSVRRPGRFPLGTLLVNLSGAAVLGLFSGLALSGDAYLLAGTALIGSYTTFSTWMLESQRLGEDRRRRLLIANVILSLAVGIAASLLGRLLGGG